MVIVKSWTLNEILGLSLVTRFKSALVRRLVEQYSSLDSALKSATELHEIGFSGGDLFSTDKSAEEIRRIAKRQSDECALHGVRIITLWSEDYPQGLREIYYPPAVLYVRGTLQASDAMAVSIVGTRKCTQYGKLCTERFAEGFSRNNLVVVSGLAYGVDAIAHKATLAAGGVTYAIIASGIDQISPSYSEKLALEISEKGGAVISEYPCGVKALPAYFPQRNRIISGISQATLVVESGEKGGSLITAKFAIDQNRELFAVPGNITSPHSRGTNLLLKRSMATPALEPEDILETIGILPTQREAAAPTPLLSEREKKVINEISGEPMLMDELSTRTAIPIHELLVLLLELEFRGLVRQLPGKMFLAI